MNKEMVRGLPQLSNEIKVCIDCVKGKQHRKAWTYLLAEKSEALHQFKCFNNIVENETSLKIKCLRTDKGGEFAS